MADQLTPESTVNIKVFDLITGVETRLGAAIGEVKGIVGGLATKDDVRRLDSRIDEVDERVEGNSGRIGVIETEIATGAALRSHKHTSWRIAGWSIGSLIGGTAAAGALMSGLHYVGLVH